jgi:hypothetical protein
VDDARAGKGAGLWTGGLPAGGTFSENQAGRWQQRFPTSLEPNWALWVCERQWPEGKRAQGGKAMGDLKADMERGRGLRAEGSGGHRRGWGGGCWGLQRAEGVGGTGGAGGPGVWGQVGSLRRLPGRGGRGG